jgi:hypothetical protein
MHDHRTARRRTLHLAGVEKIIAVDEVEASDVVPDICQMALPGHRRCRGGQ